MSQALELFGWHALLAVLPLIAGGVVAVLAAAATRRTQARWPTALVSGVGVLPVVAVWLLLPLLTGEPLRRVAHLEFALAVGVAAVTVRALTAVPTTRQLRRSAAAVGHSWWWRTMLTVRVWLPALTRGLRRSWGGVVAGITLAALIADSAANGLGRMLVAGWRADEISTVLVGTALVVLLAALGEAGLTLIGRLAGIQPLPDPEPPRAQETETPAAALPVAAAPAPVVPEAHQ